MGLQLCDKPVTPGSTYIPDQSRASIPQEAARRAGLTGRGLSLTAIALVNVRTMVETHKHDRPESDMPSRPTKRPRTAIIRSPDGFSEPEPQSKPKVAYKPPADMNFTSVFDTGSTPDSAASSVSIPKKEQINGTSRLVNSGFKSNDLGGNGMAQRDASVVSKTRKSALVRPLKPPLFATPPRPQPKANLNQKQSTESIFRRMPPASAAASTSKAPPESSKLKALGPAPPPPVLPSHKPPPALKPLPPPPHPSPSKKGKEKEISQSNLRTISTTHIALATDLTSQLGSASLLSIFLQGNKPDVDLVGEEVDGKEIRRGIGVSPVKVGGKGRGFIRSGLAERASNLLSRSQTAFTLWHKETSSLFSSTASASRRPNADLHLHIFKMLYNPSHSHSHSRSTPTARPIIALCRVIKKPQEGSGEPLANDIYPVLFSSPVPPSSNPAASFEKGKEVYVWKPWYAVELPEPGMDIEPEEEATRMQLAVGRDLTRSKHGLLCSRFLVSMS